MDIQMKRSASIIFLLVLIGYIIPVNAQTYLYQGFETGSIPEGWSEEFVYGSSSWYYQNGGYQVVFDDTLSRRPVEAYAGEKNAIFQVQNLTDTTILVTKPISSLEFAIRPVLSFYHSQYGWCHKTVELCSDPENLDWDKLNVYVRKSPSSEWILLAKYNQRVADWLYREILIPDSVLSAQTQIGFEGLTNWGYGTCIDEVEIIETGILPREITSVTSHAAGETKIPSKSDLNPVLRLDLTVKGNTGKLFLDSLKVSSANTNDDDISSFGLHLYQTVDTVFEEFTLIKTVEAFESGVATFDNLTEELQTGYSSLWIVVDVDSAAGHGNLIDLYVEANSLYSHYDTTGIFVYPNMIGVDNDILEYEYEGTSQYMPLHSSSPGEQQNPPGSQVVYQTIFIDGFETDLGWYLTGEWERDQPQGLNDPIDISYGDPNSAYRGLNILGTDLTGLGAEPGDYEELPDTNWVAISPSFDFTYFNDLSIFYARYLNTDNSDNARLEVSIDSMETWQTVWANTSLFFENEWHIVEHDISSTIKRSKDVFFRFNIGPTDNIWNLSGWNIDNFIVTGNYITADVGVVEILSPNDGCGLTTEETVSYVIKNFGAEATNDTIPFSYSLNGGVDFVQDTLFESIPIGETRTVTFDISADLSLPAAYQFVFRTDLPGDEDATNDEITKTIVSQPIFTLPYSEHFESEQGYWRTTELESSWEWGTPGILSPVGGKAWVTSISSNYPNNDSSFVESPCFNMSGITYPVFDFYYRVETQERKDGFLLEYSIDGGATWDIADTNTMGYDWPWYNDTVDVLEHRGWTGNKIWNYQKQFLPQLIAGETNVKFRFYFASDDDTTRAGAFIDGVRVYDAPYDIGIVSIDSVENACQYVNPEQISVTVKNYGIRDMQIGDTIIVGLDASRNNTIIDTLVLNTVLASDATVTLKLNETINLDTAGRYDLTAYTLIEEDPYFYSEICNDTASFTFYVHPNPYSNLEDTIKTARPDTLTVLAYYDPQYVYSWSPVGGEDDSVYHVLAAGDVFLTVTNSDSTSCETLDTINIHQLVPDLSVDSIINPISSCELDTAETVTVRIRNLGTDTLSIGDTLIIGYSVDGGLPVIDTFLLDDKFYPNNIRDFQITKDSVDLSAFSTYEFKTYLDFAWDSVPANDTLITSITTWGYPTVDLGSDVTIYTIEHVIDAGEGYSSYLWNTGDTTRYDTVSAIGNYHVTITDEHGCPNSDTVHVNFDYLDIGVTNIIEPFDRCIPSESIDITASITNTGTDTIFDNTTLQFGYRINGGSVFTDNFLLVEDLLPDSSFTHTFTDKQLIETPGDYYLEIFTLIPGDINPVNDTLADTISFYPYPELELGADTFVKAYDYVLDAGYDSTDSYLWNTGEDSSAITITIPGNYSVTVTSSHGCVSTDERKVVIVVPDVTVNGLVYPGTSCIPKYPVNMKATLYNNGTDTVFAGEVVNMGYSINGNDISTEPFELTSNLLPNATLIYEFDNSYQFSESGETNIAIFAKLSDDLNENNDTLKETIVFYDYPEVELGNDTVVKSYEFVIDAGFNVSYSYEWNTGEETSSITITNGGVYSVTVTSTEGCLTTDNRTVVMKVPDIEISELINPVSSCIPQSEINIQVNIHNNGNDTLYSGTTVKLGYRIDENTPVEVDYTLSEDLLPDAQIAYQFSEEESFNTSGTWEIVSYAIMQGDINTSNDTLKNSISFYDYPEVELGNDTLIKATSYKLIANNNPTYTYNWSTGGEDSTLTVSSNGEYSVTVTTANGCSTMDEIELLFTFPNIGILEMTEPTDLCGQDEKLVAVEIKNFGTDTLEVEEQIGVSYMINGGNIVNEQIVLEQRFLPGDIINYNFNNKVDMSEAGDYSFKIFTTLESDLLQTDDTLTQTLNILEMPVPKFMENAVNDTIVSSLPTILNAGASFISYNWDDGQRLQFHTVSSVGWYEVTVTNTNGCSGTGRVYIEEEETVCDTCGTYIDQLFDEQLSLDIYPNPANEVLNIDFDAQMPGRVIMQIFNSQGKAVIIKQTDIFKQYKETVDLYNLPNGIYILRVIYNNKAKSYRIIKQ